MAERAERTAARPYLTEYRRTRERAYGRTLRAAVAGAIIVHAVLFAVFAPFGQRIPLVRHIGYEGALRLLPEISVRRQPGEVETEVETQSGRGTDAQLEVVNTRIVGQPTLSIEAAPEPETGDEDEEFGEETLTLLERSLPQPTNRDLVILKFVKPAYPPLAIAAGLEGVVVFRVHVTKRGRVARVWILSSGVDKEMEDAARRALIQWRFQPLTANGVPTDFLVDQRIRFRLTDGSGGSGRP
jgi:TonB family protein